MSLPPNAGPARDAAILQRVKDGTHDPIVWASLTSEYEGNQAEFQVFADALKIDGVRINASAALQQQIADALDCVLLTPKLADMIWQQRQVTLPPFPRGNNVGMDSTQAMIDHSKKIDAALEKLGNPTGLIATVGKHWLIDNDNDGHLIYGVPCAENYGWHFVGQSFEGMSGETTATLIKGPDGQYIRMIQGRGRRHNASEVDYSQTVVLASVVSVLNGQSDDLARILQDKVLAYLASHQGALRTIRQPGY